ncbi:hypothetical protein A7X67_02730 [Clostridium sp. W14A]|nr:hypothetical protein A7X67_02730 [Clostridium sp. W14A]
MMELPVLDDKKYRRLFEEAVARIPLLTDKWTDFNPQDTGIMLLELLAAMTEIQIYYLDQTGDRFLNAYFDLVAPGTKGKPVPQRSAEFVREFQQVKSAVTFRDYEMLALSSSPRPEKARAEQTGGMLRLTVFRKGRLTSEELGRIYQEIKPHCLLTTRLEIRQALLAPLNVSCMVRLDADTGRSQACRAKIIDIFTGAAERKRIGERPDIGGIRVEILSVPAVREIERLSIQYKGTDLDKIRETKNLCFEIESIRLELFT